MDYQFIKLTFGWTGGHQSSWILAMGETHSDSDNRALIGNIVTLLRKGDPPILSDWRGRNFCVINVDQLALIEIEPVQPPTE
jgi:hypothetical protein